MRVNVPGSFRTLILYGDPTNQSNVNCVDVWSYLATGLAAAYTKGTTQIDNTNLQGPKQNQNWSLESVTIQAGLSFYNSLNNDSLTALPSGKFGKIYAGLVLNGLYAQTQSGSSPGISPIEQLPPDSTLVSTLWDPTQDDMPPTVGFYQADYITNPLQIATTILPTFPIDIVPGTPPSLGIWMEPSVYAVDATSGVGNLEQIGLIVSTAQYSIAYDDGLG